MNINELRQLYYNIPILTKQCKTFTDFKNIINNSINNQKGGAFSIEYKTHKIKFDKLIDNNELHLFLSTLNNKNHCIYIIIDINERIAYINEITSNISNKCFKQDEFNNGKTIMEITIKMIYKYKDKFNIDKIQLNDHSNIDCGNGIKIWLSDLSFLQHGNTFYSRFGFIAQTHPEFFNNNVNILNKCKVKDYNLNKFMNKYIKPTDENITKNIIKYYNDYYNKSILEWFNIISHKYMKKECLFFKELINHIFTKLNLKHLHQEQYVLLLS